MKARFGAYRSTRRVQNVLPSMKLKVRKLKFQWKIAYQIISMNTSDHAYRIMFQCFSHHFEKKCTFHWVAVDWDFILFCFVFDSAKKERKTLSTIEIILFSMAVRVNDSDPAWRWDYLQDSILSDKTSFLENVRRKVETQAVMLKFWLKFLIVRRNWFNKKFLEGMKIYHVNGQLQAQLNLSE